MLTLASLFDGSGGFPLAGITAGIKPIWASEIEPFAVRVTTKRFPNMKHYGDVSRIRGDEVTPVDIVSFGSPCQDLSVAGRREGLHDGQRSSLFFQAIRIIKEMREATYGRYPRYIVWENVQGALTSNSGNDFRCVLEEIAKISDPKAYVPGSHKWENAGQIVGDNYSVAYRLFDSQFWGVPQRRKRIFLVGDLNGRSAGKILFESEGMSRYSAQMFRTWQAAANNIGEGFTQAGGTGLVFENHPLDSRITGPIDVAPTIGVFGSNGDNLPIIAEPIAFGISSKDSNGFKSDNPHSGIYVANTSRTLDLNGANPSCNQGGMMVVSVDMGGGKSSAGITEEFSPTLTCTHGGAPVVAIEGNGSRPSHKGDGYKESDVMYTLNTTEVHAVAFTDAHATLSASDGPKGPTSQMLKNPEENFVVEVVNRSGESPAAYKDSSDHYTASKASYFTDWRKDTAPTLMAVDSANPVCVMDRPSYGISREAFNAGQSAQFGFNIDEGVSPTVVARGPGAVAYGIGRTAINGGYDNGMSIPIEEEISPTIIAAGGSAVATSNVPTYCATTGSFMQCNIEVAPTEAARDYKDPQIINEGEYIVRRLMPVECARLQGFPDWWCRNIETPNPTQDEIDYWRDVFITADIAMGKTPKEKTDKQIIKWLQQPYSDADEYKLWGNGISLPVASYVMCGIEWASKGR